MRVDVIMEVAPVTGEPSAGMQYILLIDAVTDESIDQVEVQADGSSTPYQFDLVPAGEYTLLSGTDLNNDGFICDPAEACGAYPVESSPVRSWSATESSTDWISWSHTASEYRPPRARRAHRKACGR